MPEFKNFRFVSPGVQIKEIDNSARPQKADDIGPVIIGRARKGIAMRPMKLQSYSDFIDMFGDTVAGNGGGDVYRSGNDMQSPMYGTYAAKAFLKSNVAPLTYIRVLGEQDSNASTGVGQAGWKTDNTLGNGGTGGAIGLWVFPSGSGGADLKVAFTGSSAGKLAAVWYLDNGTIKLSGSVYSTGSTTPTVVKSAGTLVNSNAQGEFTVEIVGTDTSRTDVVTFGFNDANENFLRKKFNTNPQLRAAGAFYTTTSERDYWLGESYEQDLRDANLTSGNLVGLIAGIALSGSETTVAPNLMKGQKAREATAGWFIGQDVGSPASYNPLNNQKLFRVLGLGHGEWLQRNLKVSIERIRQSTTDANQYGSFSLVLRRISDTDNSVEVVERFDGCTLDPTSPSFIAKKIGTAYVQWDATERRLKDYATDFPTRSKYIRIDMNLDVEAGASGMETLLPFGYYGPPKATDFTLTGSTTSRSGDEATKFAVLGEEVPGWWSTATCNLVVSSAAGTQTGLTALTCSLTFPSVRLRNSASDGGLSDATRASFGMQTTRASGSTRNDVSIADFHRLPYASFPDDPTAAAPTGFDGYSYIFSMDDIVNTLVATTGSNYIYISGSRSGSTSVSSTGSNTYKSLLDAGYDSFTAPFWGAFDGFDIRLPDPLYNNGIPASPTDLNSSIYYSWKKAIDTVADPEANDMNMLAAPGLTNNTLTSHMIDLCEQRGDALSIIDLPSIYIPPHEAFKADKANRIGTTPVNAANDLRARGLDSSYGCTFYPWVQTTDGRTGQLVWVPPSVAMMGVLASSEKRSKLWFAPAGFNRGGLSDGAAGIPILNITERLTSKNRDTLYESNINPIASFPSSGIVVFGQKTLQQTPSALDRINVRRLVIYLKKQISIISNQIIFDQNVQSTWNRFKGLAEPFLSNVLTQFGITNYSLILDETTTTDDLIDQNILYAKIAIQPARSIEYIAIDFAITNTGASFED